VLKRHPHGRERDGISHNHSLTLDLNDYLDSAIDNGNSERQIRLLVVEPESDIRVMYRRYLNSLPIDLTIVAGGRECLQAINQEHEDAYDIIIIDTHIRDSGGLHIAKRIHDENPDQQIIFTTTWDPETMGLDLMAHSLAPNKYAILHKPFMFSQLLGYIRPGKLRVQQ
jgi:CheY-like chemotaxis protein